MRKLWFVLLVFLGSCIARPYVSTPNNIPPQAIIETALSLRGKPARYGGTTPSGFDCAGFTVYVFAQHGIQLPRTAHAQARYGKKVYRRELLPADLIFFHTKSWGADLNHVGIYIGNNQFIHVGYSAPADVRIDSMNNPYYEKRFLYGRRILSP